MRTKHPQILVYSGVRINSVYVKILSLIFDDWSGQVVEYERTEKGPNKIRTAFKNTHSDGLRIDRSCLVQAPNPGHRICISQ